MLFALLHTLHEEVTSSLIFTAQVTELAAASYEIPSVMISTLVLSSEPCQTVLSIAQARPSGKNCDVVSQLREAVPVAAPSSCIHSAARLSESGLNTEPFAIPGTPSPSLGVPVLSTKTFRTWYS